MIYLSRSAPLQSSVIRAPEEFCLCGSIWKSTCPCQRFAPRFIAQGAQSQAGETGPGSHQAGGVTQNILAGSLPRGRDTALSNRCDSSCQGFGPYHHHRSTSTLWATRTLYLFFLIKIKGSHSHVQAVLMIGQYGNQVIERWGYSSSHRH